MTGAGGDEPVAGEAQIASEWPEDVVGLRGGWIEPVRPHLPQRPIWLCRACGTEWPCLAARSLLPLDHVRDPARLATDLAELFAAAMRDLYLLNPDPGPDPARMYARFLGWLTPRLDIVRRRNEPASVRPTRRRI